MMPLSHAALVARAVRWLERQKRCAFVLSEMQCNWIESPDAIGFSRRHSILVECKASRADFGRDRKKAARHEGIGMGVFRFYLTPAGLVRAHEFADLVAGPDESLPVTSRLKWGSGGWGLLWYHPESDHIKVVRPSQRFDVNLRAENLFLVSALRRVQLRITQPLHEYIRWVEAGPRRNASVLPPCPPLHRDGSHEAPYVEDDGF